ncbi:adenylate kinase isoenzyme 1-like [Lycorma delicatula]|uniref:adenylate kinase isoenzyme 1-like n=1 Tax=Lycorma delicatula TaxID=130591 RepID=UPI003F512AC1
MLISANDLTTSESALETERGALVNSILQDGDDLPPELLTDLVTEVLLSKIDEIRGVVMIGVPSCKSQGNILEKMIGPVSLIIYMEIRCTALKSMLLANGDDETTVRNKLKNFYKNIIPLTKHKKAIKVNGEKDVTFCLEECKEHLDELARS